MCVFGCVGACMMRVVFWRAVYSFLICNHSIRVSIVTFAISDLPMLITCLLWRFLYV